MPYFIMVYTIINYGIYYNSSFCSFRYTTDKWYTLQVYLGQMTRPDAYICGASAQKAKLNVVGVLEVSRGKCASLYTGSSVWDGLVVVWGVSVDITHRSFRACMHCMYWHGILEGTRAWRYNYRECEGATAPENFDTIPS